MRHKAIFNKTITALFALVFAGVLFTSSAVRADNKTVTYAMYSDIIDWDPASAFSLEVMMLVNVYEPLMWYNPLEVLSNLLPLWRPAGP